MTRTLTLLAAALGFSLTAQAHFVWLEQPAGSATAVLRFGEFAHNLREASPGLLDRFGKPSATHLSAQGEKAVDASKTAGGFALPFGAGQGEAIVAEDASFPLRRAKQGDQEVTSWFRPAARLITGFAAQPPKLALDLVPTGKAGEFKLYFKGQPLPKTKVEWLTQSGWALTGYTDEHGGVAFDMPWQGQYVAEVRHTDPTPGTRGSEKYDSVSYVTSLTFVQPSGLAPLPAAPLRTPSAK
ncbi:DUF4198 domain-containing protein [Pseudorhodoferax sp.]|uniref:DUF4198 domain-containing protein n=1 Tax=Pseudorhodoferax sp. TaxID=1993553 RepID=UPI0039E2A8F9